MGLNLPAAFKKIHMYKAPGCQYVCMSRGGRTQSQVRGGRTDSLYGMYQFIWHVFRLYGIFSVYMACVSLYGIFSVYMACVSIYGMC